MNARFQNCCLVSHACDDFLVLVAGNSILCHLPQISQKSFQGHCFKQCCPNFPASKEDGWKVFANKTTRADESTRKCDICGFACFMDCMQVFEEVCDLLKLRELMMVFLSTLLFVAAVTSVMPSAAAPTPVVAAVADSDDDDEEGGDESSNE